MLVYARWSKGLIQILLNISGLIETYKIRPISQLTEYLNLVNKLYFGCRMNQGAEESVILPKEQHGRISGHNPIEVALLISILFYYILHAR